MSDKNDTALWARGVAKRYGRRTALAGVDLAIETGAVTVLLGPNGAGKSTLLRLALGVAKPDRGTLRVLGFDPARDATALRRAVGYVPDQPDVPAWMTVEQLARFCGAHQPAWDACRVDQLVEQLGVPRRVRLAAMSKGQRAKAMLVLALGHDPRVLLLDEPFGGLDPLVREEVLRAVIGTVDGARRTVLCATHELDVAARLADRVAVMIQGRVCAHGSVAEVLDEPEPADLPRRLHEVVAAMAAAVAPC